jgi:hypothetical protein
MLLILLLVFITEHSTEIIVTCEILEKETIPTFVWSVEAK